MAAAFVAILECSDLTELLVMYTSCALRNSAKYSKRELLFNQIVLQIVTNNIRFYSQRI